MFSLQGSKRSCHQGFVLLIVLVAIIIVGVALTRSARQTAQASIAAIDAHSVMQRQWGIESLQRALLPAASQLFEISDRSTRKQRGKQQAFPSIMSDRVVLGKQTFDLLLADEDAKANLNTIYDAGKERACQQAIKDLTGLIGIRSMRLLPSRTSAAVVDAKQSSQESSSLSPTTTTEENFSSRRPKSLAFRSFGEVFDIVQIHQLAGDDRELAKLTRQITLLGSGRLNVFRATDDSFLAVCKSVVQDGQAKRLLEKVRETSLSEIRLILEATISDPSDRQRLEPLLGDSSTRFSLWIESTNGKSRTQTFIAQTPGISGESQTIKFSFD